MKILGIIGGIGPQSTMEYYRLIMATYRAQTQDGSFLPLILNSIDLKKMLDLIGAHEFEAVTDYLVEEVNRIARAGADFGLLAANTPHIVFEEIQRQSPIPLISIVEVTCETAKNLGFTKVGLFGTRFTMQGNFYTQVFEREGISLVVPDLEDQTYIHDKYMSEFVEGVFLAETRSCLLAILLRLKEQEGIQGLILGGTELSLILREAAYQGVSILDTTRIHVEHAIARLLK
jgi:aspartate racemase